MRKPDSENENPCTPLVDAEGNLTRLFDITIEDIFRKFDLHFGRELSYDEFLVFYQCTGI
jgi:hypothetical protein